MGEVRAKVRLTNAFDDELRRQGKLAKEEVRSYEADALVDTGAVRSVVPAHVVEKIGASIRGQRVAEYADGRQETVGLTGPILFDIQGRDTLEEALVLGDEVLVGQTVLEKLDLLPDCANRRLIPNPAHPDQPVSKVK
jgi:clan AA aspartic protease